MKQYIIGAILGALLSTVFYVYQLAQPGAVKVSINLSQETLNKMTAGFNPAANSSISLNSGLDFICPGKEAQTCMLQFVPVK